MSKPSEIISFDAGRGVGLFEAALSILNDGGLDVRARYHGALTVLGRSFVPEVELRDFAWIDLDFGQRFFKKRRNGRRFRVAHGYPFLPSSRAFLRSRMAENNRSLSRWSSGLAWHTSY